MKLFVQLAVILAFAAPVFANAATAVSHPAHKVTAKKKAKKAKKEEKKDAAAPAGGDTTAAPAEGGKM